MIILRLALLTALIYVGFALAIEVALFILAKIHGGCGIFMSRPGGWFLFFGVLWLVSFLIAYRMSPFFKPGALPK